MSLQCINVKFKDCDLVKSFAHMCVYAYICTYLRRALFQKMFSEIGIGIATSIFGLAPNAFRKITIHIYIYIYIYEYVYIYVYICIYRRFCLFVCLKSTLLLFYAVSTSVAQLYLGCLLVMILHHSNSISVISRRLYDVWDEEPEPTLLPTQAIFNLPHHIGMVEDELAFDDYASYAQWGDGLLDVITATKIHTPVPRITYPTF